MCVRFKAVTATITLSKHCPISCCSFPGSRHAGNAAGSSAGRVGTAKWRNGMSCSNNTCAIGVHLKEGASSRFHVAFDRESTTHLCIGLQ